MEGVLIGGNDESDHTLEPFWIPANVGDPVPKKITEALFRKAMRDTICPGALLALPLSYVGPRTFPVPFVICAR